MSEAYKKVIDALTEGSVDFKSIGIGLTKHCPEAFMMLYELANNGRPRADKRVERMNEVIRNLYAKGERVHAIKTCRDIGGWGLKEAKDYCDSIAGGGNPQLPSPLKPLDVATPPAESSESVLASLQAALAASGSFPTPTATYADGGTF